MRDDITKPTRIYGASDDLLEIEGGINGEQGCYDTSEDEPCAVFLSDGTVLSFVYAPEDHAIWKARVLEKGALFDRLDICTDENADPYSDVVHMKPGVTWVYAMKIDEKLERVR